MNALPPSTVQHIASGQVITSVSSAVKELVENSLDAGATSVLIRLENFGLDLIEVRDNGHGISPSEAYHAALAHYTSKLRRHEDLQHVSSYGFRGEALSSLCCVSQVKITSRTVQEEVAQQYSLDGQGHVLSAKPSAGDVGTAVAASEIFSNLPVRRQVFKNVRRCREELREVEDRLMALALAVPSVRIQLLHSKQTIWQRPGGGDFTAAAVSVFGSSVFSQLKLHYHGSSASPATNEDGLQLQISALLPKPLASMSSVIRSTPNRSFIIINNRPVDHPALHKKIRHAVVAALQSVSSSISSHSSKQHPAYCVLIQMPTQVVDVNVNPAKSMVIINSEDVLLQEVDTLLDKAYPASDRPASQASPSAGYPSEQTTRASNDNALSAADVDPRNGEILDEVSDAPVPSFRPAQMPSDQWLDLVDDDLMLEGDTGIATASTGKGAPAASTADLSSDDVVRGSVLSPDDPASSQCVVATPPSSMPGVSALLSQQRDVELDRANLEPSSDHNTSRVSKTTFEDTAGLATVGGDGWSRGHQLVTAEGDTVEPIMLLAPRGNTSTGASLSHQPEHRSLAKPCPTTTASSSNDITNSIVSPARPDHPSSEHTISTPRAPSSPPRLCNIGQSTATSPSSPGAEPAPNVPATTTSAETHTSRTSDVCEVPTRAMATPTVPNFTLDISDLSQPTSTLPPVIQRAVAHAEKRMAEMTPTLAAKKPRSSPAVSHNRQQAMKSVKLSYALKPLTEETFNYDTGGPVVDVPISFQSLKSRFLAADAGDNRDEWAVCRDCDGLVGALHPSGVWCMLQNAELCIFNQFRAKELLVFEQLCRDHSLACQPLDKAIAITAEIMKSQRCWDRLCSMSWVTADISGTRECDDPLLVKNGFRLSQEPGGGISLVSVTTSMPFYGYPDLVELLEMIVTTEAGGEEATVCRCRPQKVLSHFKCEAVRLCRKMSATTSANTVSEVMASVLSRPESDRKCFHDRDIIYAISNLAELTTEAE